MEAPPGMTGRLFVAVEPYESERRALRIWPKELLGTTSRRGGASPSGEGQVLREATRPIEIADLREVSNLRTSTEDRVEIVGRETHIRPILLLP
jgi:hypothetical protein